MHRSIRELEKRGAVDGRRWFEEQDLTQSFDHGSVMGSIAPP